MNSMVDLSTAIFNSLPGRVHLQFHAGVRQVMGVLPKTSESFDRWFMGIIPDMAMGSVSAFRLPDYWGALLILMEIILMIKKMGINKLGMINHNPLEILSS